MRALVHHPKGTLLVPARVAPREMDESQNSGRILGKECPDGQPSADRLPNVADVELCDEFRLLVIDVSFPLFMGCASELG